MPNSSLAIRAGQQNTRQRGSTPNVTTTITPMIAEVRSGPVLPPILTPLVFSATAAVFDSEGQFAGTKLRRDWRPNEPLTPALREAAADYLDLITDYIRPGDQDQISLRLAALRAHWSESDDDQSVKQLVAVDWQRSVGIFPLWAVVGACEDWIDTQRRRPMIADIRKLCAEAVEEYVLHIDILRRALSA